MLYVLAHSWQFARRSVQVEFLQFSELASRMV